MDIIKDQIRNGPEFDPEKPVNQEYEIRFYDYYGRPFEIKIDRKIQQQIANPKNEATFSKRAEEQLCHAHPSSFPDSFDIKCGYPSCTDKPPLFQPKPVLPTGFIKLSWQKMGIRFRSGDS